MTRSVFFRRIMALLLLTIGLSALLTSTLFYLISRNIFIRQKTDELQWRANAIVGFVSLYQHQIFSFDNLERALANQDLRSSHLFIYDFTNKKRFISTDVPKEALLLYEDTFTPLLDQVMKGESVRQSANYDGGQLIVGVPVYDDIMDSSSPVTGCVFVSQSMEQVTSARDSLYLTLTLTVCIVSAVMVVLAAIVSQRISRPISEMGHVAETMAKGDFTIRADDSQPMELGEMARSLNFLSGRLSQTISELVLERNRLKQILDGLSEGILALNKDGQVTHYNPAMADFFGHPPELLENRDAFLQDSDLWNDFDTALNEVCNVVRTFRWKNRTIRVDISPILNDLNICVGVVGLFRDITESERLEQTRREYVANVSHELRTPISAIRSLTETLMDGLITKPEDIQRYYGYLLSESLRLSRLVDDLLELSHLQSSNTAFEAQRLSIYDLLDESASRIFPIMKERGVTLRVDVPDGCPDAYANEDRIEQILMILLDNASKFTDEGGSVTLSAHWTSEQIQINVADTGCGIDEEDLSQVFDRFYKADKSHSGSGTGLGLSICKEIISIINQRIWVESTLGEGTTFSFTLPRCDAYHEAK